MNKKALVTTFSMVFVAIACNMPIVDYHSVTTTPKTEITNLPPSGSESVIWNRVFDDEFNRTVLDAHWITEYPWGRVNPPELQYYGKDVFYFNGSALSISAQNRQTDDSLPYTSGLISSYDSFQFTYGYVIARVKVPSGKGLWPAFWLLTSDKTDWGEIDVMEIIGSEPSTVYMTLHYGDATNKSQFKGKAYHSPDDFSKDFHNFAVNWSPNAVIWYVDGVERFRMDKYIPHGPMYLIANLAVGGEWPGAPDASTTFPANYYIDFIRVYQH